MVVNIQLITIKNVYGKQMSEIKRLSMEEDFKFGCCRNYCFRTGRRKYLLMRYKRSKKIKIGKIHKSNKTYILSGFRRE